MKRDDRPNRDDCVADCDFAEEGREETDEDHLEGCLMDRDMGDD
jgi:hypothetical protein